MSPDSSYTDVKSQFSCPNNPKSSMFTVSVGKRVQGDDVVKKVIIDYPAK